eukprot:g38030.t1
MYYLVQHLVQQEFWELQALRVSEYTYICTTRTTRTSIRTLKISPPAGPLSGREAPGEALVTFSLPRIIEVPSITNSGMLPLLLCLCVVRGSSVLDCSTTLDNINKLARQVDDTDGEFAKYAIMAKVQARCTELYYRALAAHTELLLPVVYTPAVGAGCWNYGLLEETRPGLVITPQDKGKVVDKLKGFAQPNVQVIVATDGERILGLGDLGVWGMGIPVGKLALYSALGGIDPAATLPIAIDVGTNTQRLKDSDEYLGVKTDRVRGSQYHELVEELVDAIKSYLPKALLQFEDFGKTNAFDLLERHKDSLPSFNDDVQGTAAVTVAGIKSAMRLTGEHRVHKGTYLFLGAGQAGIGIGELLVYSMVKEEGLSPKEAYKRVWLMDSQGLITAHRHSAPGGRPLDRQKKPFAHTLPATLQHGELADLVAVIKAIKPTHLIGVSGQPATFTEQVVRAMAEANPASGPVPPLIFALSNPTSKSECTAQQAYDWSGGRAIFASGSPFKPVTLADGSRRRPGQANNCYVFPGVGLGVSMSGAQSVTQEMILGAANAVGALAKEEDLREGCLFPSLEGGGRMVAASVAAAVSRVAHKRGLARNPKPKDHLRAAFEFMYDYDLVKEQLVQHKADVNDHPKTELRRSKS